MRLGPGHAEKVDSVKATIFKACLFVSFDSKSSLSRNLQESF